MSNDEKPNARHSRLTLVEVIIGGGILVVFVVLFFAMMGKLRERKNSAVCTENLRQIRTALEAYLPWDIQDGKNYHAVPLPPATTSNEVFQVLLDTGFLKDANVVRCPSDKKLLPPTGRAADKGQCSYSIGQVNLMSDMPIIPTAVILTDAEPRHKDEDGKKIQIGSRPISVGNSVWKIAGTTTWGGARLDPRY